MPHGDLSEQEDEPPSTPTTPVSARLSGWWRSLDSGDQVKLLIAGAMVALLICAGTAGVWFATSGTDEEVETVVLRTYSGVSLVKDGRSDCVDYRIAGTTQKKCLSWDPTKPRTELMHLECVFQARVGERLPDCWR